MLQNMADRTTEWLTDWLTERQTEACSIWQKTDWPIDCHYSTQSSLTTIRKSHNWCNKLQFKQNQSFGGVLMKFYFWTHPNSSELSWVEFIYKICRHVPVCLVPDVSRKSSGFIFKDRNGQEKFLHVSDIRGATPQFGEFDHKKFLTVNPSFHRLFRSSPLGHGYSDDPSMFCMISYISGSSQTWLCR
jgi:hypothetical protein